MLAYPVTYEVLDRMWGGLTIGVQVALHKGVEAGELLVIREAEEGTNEPTGRSLVRRVHRVDENPEKPEMVHVTLLTVEPTRERKR